MVSFSSSSSCSKRTNDAWKWVPPKTTTTIATRDDSRELDQKVTSIPWRKMNGKTKRVAVDGYDVREVCDIFCAAKKGSCRAKKVVADRWSVAQSVPNRKDTMTGSPKAYP